jgi:hypothetical protein
LLVLSLFSVFPRRENRLHSNRSNSSLKKMHHYIYAHSAKTCEKCYIDLLKLKNSFRKFLKESCIIKLRFFSFFISSSSIPLRRHGSRWLSICITDLSNHLWSNSIFNHYNHANTELCNLSRTMRVSLLPSFQFPYISICCTGFCLINGYERACFAAGPFTSQFQNDWFPRRNPS